MSSPSSKPSSRRFVPRIALVALGLVIVLAVLYFLNVAALYRQERREAADQSAFLAQAMARTAAMRAASSLRVLDFGLLEQRGKYLQGDPDLAESIRLFANAFEEASPTVSILDATGRVVFSTRPAAERLDLASRDYFREQLRDYGQDRLLLTRPFMGKFRSHDIVVASRPIVRHGKFTGILIAALNPDYLFSPLNEIAMNAAPDVQLAYGLHDTIVAANQASKWQPGRAVADQLGFAPTGSDGIRHMTGPDGDVRAIAWASVQGLPLQAFARVDSVASAGPQVWRRNLAFGLVMFPLVLGLIVLASYSHRQYLRSREQDVMYRTLFHDSALIQLLVDPQTRHITDANPAACRFYGCSLAHLRNCTLADLGEEPPTPAGPGDGPRPFVQIASDAERRTVEATLDTVVIHGKPLLHYAIQDVTERHTLQARLHRSESLYRTLFEAVPNGVLVVDEDVGIRRVNAAAVRMLGGDEASIRARATHVFDTQGNRLETAALPSSQALRADLNNYLVGARGSDGTARWLSVNSRRLPEVAGEASSAVVTFSDVTRLVELEKANRIGGLVFDASPEGIAVLRQDFRIAQVNPALAQLLGADREQLFDRSPFQWAQDNYALRRRFTRIARALRGGGKWKGELPWQPGPDGKTRTLELQIVAIDAPSQPDRAEGYVALLSDITARKEIDAVNWHRANVDQLTGLPNRLHLIDQLGMALARASVGRPVTVLFLDLNGFKTVNDAYGHDAGDEVLAQAALRFQGALRSGDTVSRWGGDEFIVLLPAADSQAGLLVAERLVEVLSPPMLVQGRSVRVGTSIGVAQSYPGETDRLGLIKRADEALYRAKRQQGTPRIMVAGDAPGAA